jgi:CRP-like cAMP-binding protein
MLANDPFFKDFRPDHLTLLAGCAANERYEAGSYLLRQGQEAARFFLIRRGLVRIELFVPGRGAIPIQTIEAGEVLGWSWLVDPYRWSFSAQAVQPTTALSFDGACLREKMTDDYELGYRLMRRFLLILAERLDATRVRLLDVYADTVKSP